MLDKRAEEAFNTWEALQSLHAFEVLFLKAGRRKSWLYVRKGATSLGPTALLEPFSWLQPFCLCSEPRVEGSSRAPFPGLAARLGTAPKPAVRELQLGAALGVLAAAAPRGGSTETASPGDVTWV